MPYFDSLIQLLDSPGTWCILSSFDDTPGPPLGSSLTSSPSFSTDPLLSHCHQPNWLKLLETLIAFGASFAGFYLEHTRRCHPGRCIGQLFLRCEVLARRDFVKALIRLEGGGGKGQIFWVLEEMQFLDLSNNRKTSFFRFEKNGYLRKGLFAKNISKGRGKVDVDSLQEWSSNHVDRAKSKPIKKLKLLHD